MRQELIEFLCQKSVHFSETPVYKLVSGTLSDFYVDCKPTTLHPRGMFLVGNLVLDALEGLSADGIGGMTFGADPVAMATAFASGLRGVPMKAFSIRKTRKEHGMARWIEGDMAAGERVVIVDDVVTTGGSTVRAIERARSEGLEVVKAIILVDRQEGGLDTVRRHVADAQAVVTREQLVARWSRKKG